MSPTPRPETAMTAYEGDILVYKGSCKSLSCCMCGAPATSSDPYYQYIARINISTVKPVLNGH